MSASFEFVLTHRDGQARRGRLTLPHGVVATPAFMPVGTRAAIKGLTIDQVIALDPDVILANTYHLHLRPGDPLIADLGGLHAFMGWSRPLLTDSGGYQVFSLASRRRLSEEGVIFQSHIDGRALSLSPESAADIQARLGADIAMVFDECPAWPATVDQIEASMERTLRWARRGRERFLAVKAGSVDDVSMSTPGQVQFGIVQGGTWPALRDRSAAGTVAIGFDAYAIGGLSVGEPTDVMYATVDHTAAQLPVHLPRYLMGAGTPADLVECVARGIDMFDCVLPTRNARNGQLFTRRGPIAIKNARYVSDPRPVDPDCGCPVCQRHSRAYLRHLFMVGEMSAAALNTIHNLYFYLDTMRAIGKAIESGSFSLFRRAFHDAYSRRTPA